MTNTLTMELLTSTSMTKIFNFELFKVRQQDKEDVKQNCVVEILKALKNAKEEIPTEKLPSFCQTIIKRTVVDYYRKTNRMIDTNSTLVHYCDGFGDEEGGEDTSTFAHESVENGYDLSEVRVDYDLNRTHFTPREREIVDYLLYNNKGIAMNLTEIAKELSINKSHATRAVSKLREICC